MEACYVYHKTMEEEDLIHLIQTKIQEDPKYNKEFDSKLISITKGYFVYQIIDASIKNLQYLTLRNKKEQSGVIDVEYNYVSKDFLLRELSTKPFELEEASLEEYHIFNQSDLEIQNKEFIDQILQRTEKSICKRHNLILTDRVNELDISPIKDFEKLNRQYYLEEVYVVDYFEKGNKKSFRSMYSTYFEDFYFFDYKKSKEYEEFYKLYRRPIVYLPKRYLDMYYDLAFQVYLDTKKELQFMKPTDLLNKLRKNIQYKEYSKHEDYLKQLIFYFRKKEYLKEFSITYENLRHQIFYCYLTLKYNPQSGYDLANLVQSHVIDDNYLKLLEVSAKQKHTLAKKALFEYYSEPVSYNSYYLKRYS